MGHMDKDFSEAPDVIKEYLCKVLETLMSLVERIWMSVELLAIKDFVTLIKVVKQDMEFHLEQKENLLIRLSSMACLKKT